MDLTCKFNVTRKLFPLATFLLHPNQGIRRNPDKREKYF